HWSSIMCQYTRMNLRGDDPISQPPNSSSDLISILLCRLRWILTRGIVFGILWGAPRLCTLPDPVQLASVLALVVVTFGAAGELDGLHIFANMTPPDGEEITLELVGGVCSVFHSGCRLNKRRGRKEKKRKEKKKERGSVWLRVEGELCC